MTRAALYALLAVVAAAAAVLSFAALRDLALLCGFDEQLAWLLPVVVDAGAAAGSLVWMTTPGGSARRFGRHLALALLGSSVVGNGVAHLLDAYRLTAPWWLVVGVSALAPAVLASVLHLAVLAVQARTGGAEQAAEPPAEHVQATGTPDDKRGVSTPKVIDALDRVDHGPAGEVDGADDLDRSRGGAGSTTAAAAVDDRAAALIAAGAGRRRLAKELAISEYEARQLQAASRNGSTP